jgi:hypothetical protein
VATPDSRGDLAFSLDPRLCERLSAARGPSRAAPTCRRYARGGSHPQSRRNRAGWRIGWPGTASAGGASRRLRRPSPDRHEHLGTVRAGPQRQAAHPVRARRHGPCQLGRKRRRCGTCPTQLRAGPPSPRRGPHVVEDLAEAPAPTGPAGRARAGCGGGCAPSRRHSARMGGLQRRRLLTRALPSAAMVAFGAVGASLAAATAVLTSAADARPLRGTAWAFLPRSEPVHVEVLYLS